jgi:acyl-CoA dehydrogenase
MTGTENSDRSTYQEVRDAASKILAPIAAAGPHGRVSRELLRATAATGILHRLFPTGAGARASASTICQIREALGYGCPAADVAVSMQGIGGYPILQSGQPHQRDRWIGPMRDGTAVAGFALTEPDVGSDAAAITLEAVPDGDGWRLHGVKQWITNAPDADFYVTFARTTAGARARGVTAFVVPGDAPGLSGTPIDLLADHPIGRLEYDGVRVGTADVLGEVDRGFRVAMKTFDLFRPSVGAAAIGMGHAALDATVDRTAYRQAFGRAIGSNQAVAHALADAATRLEASRHLVEQAALAYEAGDPRVTVKAAMAKVFATETAHAVIDTAVQFHGASGLEAGHLLESLYREVRASRIFEGASEIQRDLIARDLYRQTPLDPGFSAPAAPALERS